MKFCKNNYYLYTFINRMCIFVNHCYVLLLFGGMVINFKNSTNSKF